MWLHLPASCLSSLGTEALTLASKPPAEPDLWCWSSGTPLPRPSSWHGWKKRPWRRLLSGTTLPPSTADAGVASWIASLAAAPARTSPSPESGLASMVREADSGGNSSASLTRQGLLFSSGKTSEVPSPPRWTWSRKTLRAGGSELRLALFALKTWVRPTNESASLSWPTPTATDAKGSGSAAYSTESGRHSGVTLTDAAVRNWPTPRASDGDKGGPNQTQKGVPSLVALERSGLWETPAAGQFNYSESPESFEARSAELLARGSRPLGVNLGQQAQRWATPAARDHRDNHGGGGLSHGRYSDSLPVQVRRGTPGMVLNPAFVESLMGLPRGWTSPSPMTGSASWETASSGSKRRRLSLSVGSGSSEVRDG